jgi:uncharacterized protein (DUF1800 family)
MLAESETTAAPSSAERADPAAAGKLADPGWAWAPYEPDAQRPWNLRWAGHLYRRAAFGATWEQLQQALRSGPQRTIDTLLQPEADLAAFQREQDQYEAASSDSIEGLRGWWLRRMILTPHPLLEKMTLFWHNHFAVGHAKVNGPVPPLLIGQHVRLLRSHALGRFEALLNAVTRDPATLLWLDNSANRHARPNDRFARVLLESYSLGPGRCSAEDIRDAARALTGWSVLQHQFRYIDHEHDFGPKRILGQEGNFDGADVVRIVLGQPATAEFLVRKLYRWLISETCEPSDRLVAPLAAAFAKDYDVAKLTETLLRSNLFFSPVAYRQRIKSPVEFALGIVKGLEELVATAELGQHLAALGQNLYDPPTIKGWQGGRTWINRVTLLDRLRLAGALLAPSGPYGGKLDPAAVAQKHGSAAPAAAGQFLLDLWLQGDVEPEVAQRVLPPAQLSAEQDKGGPGESLRQSAYEVLCLPEFQLA